MKVITMESAAYKAMAEQIAEIAGYIREIKEVMRHDDTDRLLDTNEAVRELGISKRTLQRMRDEHRIRYVVLRGKCQYRLSEIRRILDAHTIREDGRTLDELHHNSRLPTGNGRQKKGRKEDMTMELLTKKLFEQWMGTILERLDRQDEMLLALKAPEKRNHMPDKIRLFDNQDLCQLLQISKRSLQRYRSIGALPYKILGKKTYYSEDDVLKFLSEHIKDFQKEDVEFYKARIHNFFNK